MTARGSDITNRLRAAASLRPGETAEKQVRVEERRRGLRAKAFRSP